MHHGAGTRNALRRGEAGGTRLSHRAPLDLECAFFAAGGRWHTRRITDLSITGFRLAWAPEMKVGVRMWIRVAGLEPLAARIIWRNGSQAGCEFLVPLNPYVFEHVVREVGN
jgi:hypothetical protein